MAHDYSSEATQRCERVLGTLMRGIGQPWRHKVCLVGGLVPLYLVDGNDYAQPAHVGSTDVDVALRLVVDSQDDGAYETLRTNLKRNGFERVDNSSWRWWAQVDGHSVVLEFLGDVLVGAVEVDAGAQVEAAEGRAVGLQEAGHGRVDR